MKIGMYFCQVTIFSKNLLALQKIEMTAIFQDGHHFQIENKS